MRKAEPHLCHSRTPVKERETEKEPLRSEIVVGVNDTSTKEDLVLDSEVRRSSMTGWLFVRTANVIVDIGHW